jgi:hypothetical protein
MTRSYYQDLEAPTPLGTPNASVRQSPAGSTAHSPGASSRRFRARDAASCDGQPWPSPRSLAWQADTRSAGEEALVERLKLEWQEKHKVKEEHGPAVVERAARFKAERFKVEQPARDRAIHHASQPHAPTRSRASAPASGSTLFLV